MESWIFLFNKYTVFTGSPLFLGGMPVDPIGLEKDSSRAFSRNTV
jgi:hypothetical protein